MKFIMTKALVVVFGLFIIPIYLKAQEFPFGKSKEEVRQTVAKSKFPFGRILQSDTCDVYYVSDLLQENCYFKNNICYKLRMVYTTTSADAMQKSTVNMRKILDETYKKIADDIWDDAKDMAKITLTINKDKNQFYVEYSGIKD